MSLRIEIRFFKQTHSLVKHQTCLVFTTPLPAKHTELGQPHSLPSLQLPGFAPERWPLAKPALPRLGWYPREMFSSWKEVLKISLGRVLHPHFYRFSEVQSWLFQSCVLPALQPAPHSAARSAEVCECLWSGRVNRMLLDEERIVQLPVIRHCLTCKYMLRQKDAAALCYSAVKF